MLRLALTIASLILFVVSPARTQLTQQTFHDQVLSTYSFSPHLLSSGEIAARSASLDSFWTSVQSSPGLYLPLLRVELNARPIPEFFAYDGAKLLLALSSESSDMALAAAALGQCNLLDVSREDFVVTVNKLANQGADVWPAAFKLLDEPSFSVYFPRHSLKMNQNYSFICCVFPMNDTAAVSKIVTRLSTVRNDTSCATLLLALWYATTDAGFNAILNIGTEKTVSEATRKYGFELSTKMLELMGKHAGKPTPQTYAELALQRSKCLKVVSDENLYEFERLTGELQAAYFNR